MYRIYEHFEANSAESDGVCEQTFGQGFFSVTQWM